VVGELWRPAGGAYNVDNVLNLLNVMVSGLEEELKARIEGNKVYSANSLSPSAPKDFEDDASISLSRSKSPTALSSNKAWSSTTTNLRGLSKLGKLIFSLRKQ
jgi:hypothetical protein